MSKTLVSVDICTSTISNFKFHFNIVFGIVQGNFNICGFYDNDGYYNYRK